MSNRILGIFYLCGGEDILKSEKKQRDLKLTWLLERGILLTAKKVEEQVFDPLEEPKPAQLID